VHRSSSGVRGKDVLAGIRWLGNGREVEEGGKGGGAVGGGGGNRKLRIGQGFGGGVPRSLLYQGGGGGRLRGRIFGGCRRTSVGGEEEGGDRRKRSMGSGGLPPSLKGFFWNELVYFFGTRRGARWVD